MVKELTRTLALEGIKQAWQLRREGKQQSEIAEVLNLSLRHVQNYLSIDWLSQRSLKALMKGRADEVNEQLKILFTVGEAATGGPHKKTKSKAKAAADSGNAAESGQSSVCQATERWADVALLED